MIKNSRYFAVVASVALIVALAIYALVQREQKEEAQQDLSYETAKILTEKFSEKAALQVMTVSGELVVSASDSGFAGLLATSQKRRLPYSVDYFVDLSDLGPEKYRWLASESTMIIEIPDVTISRPNIDESRAKGGTPDGLFVSRGAAMRLNQKLAARSTSFAADHAKKPENLEKARRSARDKIEKFVSAPLAVAGLGKVVVVTRYPWENTGIAKERWDYSTPLIEIMRSREERLKAQ